MKKIVLIFVMFILVCLPVSAQQSEEQGNSSYYNKAESFAAEYGIDFKTLKENPFDTLWNTALSAVKKALTSPAKIFGRITAILLLTSFINLFSQDGSKQIVQLINAVTMLVLFANVYDSLTVMISQTTERFIDVKNFMTAFLPVLAGFSFSSGEMVTSTLYTGFFMICVVTVANFSINYIVPSLNLFMAVGITASLLPAVNLKPLCDLYSKAVKIAMTASVSVLCFVLTLQTAITQGQDNLAVKTGKAIIGSAVPIIGSALQSAVGSVYASVGVLKGFFGLAGIVVIINIFLPSIVNLAANWLGYYLMSALGEVLENKTAAEILSVFKGVTEILLSMSVLFMVLLIFSMTILIKTTQGV